MSKDHLDAVLGNEREWRLHILKEIENIKKSQSEISKEVWKLEVKSGVWGVLGGASTTLAGLLLYFFKGGAK